MHFVVAVTDNDRFALHAAKASVGEVNFWRPLPDATFRGLQPDEPLLFKLHAADNYIAGGGFFARLVRLPLSLVWGAFGESNGVRSLEEMREKIARYGCIFVGLRENPNVGCVIDRPRYF